MNFWFHLFAIQLLPTPVPSLDFALNKHYLPVRALAKIFKAKFKKAMKKNGMLPVIDTQVWQITWNINCQAVGDAEASLKYLGPYVFRVAISDNRIVNVDRRSWLVLRFRSACIIQLW